MRVRNGAESDSLQGNAVTLGTMYFVEVTVVIASISTAALYSLDEADNNARILYFSQERITHVMCINSVVRFLFERYRTCLAQERMHRGLSQCDALDLTRY